MLTIITINFNNAEGLTRTLDSCASQVDQKYFHIVVDGKSTDGSKEIAARYENTRQNILHVRDIDTGIYDAMNVGLRNCVTNWVLFLNSGDELVGKSVTKVLLPILRHNDSYSLVYGDIIAVDPTSGREEFVEQKLTKLGFLKNVCHQATIYNRKRLGRSLWFSTKYQISADFDVLLRIICNQGLGAINKIPVTIAKYEKGGFSDTNLNTRLAERSRIVSASSLAQYRKWLFWGDTARLRLVNSMKKMSRVQRH